MDEAERFSFPKALRLRRREEFLAVQRKGKRRSCRYVLIIVQRRRQQGPTRLGVTVSRKVGSAVVRNRVKRLIREAFRVQQHLLPVSLDVVVVAKREARTATLTELQTALRDAMTALERKDRDSRRC